MGLRKSISAAWQLIWHGKGFKSWLAFLAFAFVSMFLVYRTLLFVLSFFGVVDLVSVVSGSMVHASPSILTTYNTWLDIHGYNETSYDKWPFSNGLNLGDLVVVSKVNQSDLHVGDVIIYLVEGKYQIIHRIIKIDDNGTITTKGDANPTLLSFENNVTYSQVVGRADFSIPLLGVPKMIVSNLL